VEVKFRGSTIEVFRDRRGRVTAIISGATPEVLRKLQKPAVVSELARRFKAEFAPLEVEDAIRTRVRQFLHSERTVGYERRRCAALRQILNGRGRK
jgi:hypothetical protein